MEWEIQEEEDNMEEHVMDQHGGEEGPSESSTYLPSSPTQSSNQHNDMNNQHTGIVSSCLSSSFTLSFYSISYL